MNARPLAAPIAILSRVAHESGLMAEPPATEETSDSYCTMNQEKIIFALNSKQACMFHTRKNLTSKEVVL